MMRTSIKISPQWEENLQALPFRSSRYIQFTFVLISLFEICRKVREDDSFAQSEFQTTCWREDQEKNPPTRKSPRVQGVQEEAAATCRTFSEPEVSSSNIPRSGEEREKRCLNGQQMKLEVKCLRFKRRVGSLQSQWNGRPDPWLQLLLTV